MIRPSRLGAAESVELEIRDAAATYVSSHTVTSVTLNVYVTPSLQNGLVCKLGVWFAKRLGPSPVCKVRPLIGGVCKLVRLKAVLQNHLWILQTEGGGSLGSTEEGMVSPAGQSYMSLTLRRGGPDGLTAGSYPLFKMHDRACMNVPTAPRCRWSP